MKDVFGREVKAGDKVAVGMNLNQSSVLRIGEVLYVKEKPHPYREDGFKWSVRIKWTHDGSTDNNWRNVKESTILGETGYQFAKFVILPEGFVEQFPPDITEQ